MISAIKNHPMATNPDLKSTLANIVALSPNKPAIVFDEFNTTLTFGDLDTHSDDYAKALTALGVTFGDRVAVMLRNRPEFPITWLALAKIGAAMVPLNIYYGQNDARHILRDSNPILVITQSDFIPLLATVLENDDPVIPKIVCVDDDQHSQKILNLNAAIQRGQREHTAATKTVTPETILNIQYTSGTTGSPKGCMLSQAYWTRMGRIVTTTDPGLSNTDVMLTAQPFYYMDPQWNLASVLQSGGKLIVLDRFHPSTFWDKVRQYDVTFFYCLGMMPSALYSMPPSELDKIHSVRYISCSAIPTRLHAKLEARWGAPWYEAYGMTETGSISRLLPDDHTPNVGMACIGSAYSDRDIRIIDPEGEPVNRGEEGELVLRGSGMMDGYYNNRHATDSTFINGWFRTGDLVVQSVDGLLYYRGRNKDIIRRSGENISASEVEAALMEHPDIALAACVPVPDELRGEEVKAYIILHSNQPPEPAMAPYITWCKERLAYFKIPRFWQVVQNMPMTPSERVAKNELVANSADLRHDSFDAHTTEWFYDTDHTADARTNIE